MGDQADRLIDDGIQNQAAPDDTQRPEETTAKCPDCGGIMVFKRGKYGAYLGCTRWPACKGSHCVHQKTLEPMGEPANAVGRAARREAHRIFDHYWRTNGIKRNEAYRLLAEKMGLTKDQCHVGSFDQDQCKQVIEIVKTWKGS